VVYNYVGTQLIRAKQRGRLCFSERKLNAGLEKMRGFNKGAFV